MDIDDLKEVTTLTDKRLTLLGHKTGLEGTAQITVGGRDIAKVLTPERVIAARAALLPIVNDEIADTEATLAALDVQV